MVNVLSVDFHELNNRIYNYREKEWRSPKYIVMSQATYDIIQDSVKNEFRFIDEPSKLCGVDIAINNTLGLGDVDVV